MRVGMIAHGHGEAAMAEMAENHGLFGLAVGFDDPVASINAAVYASVASSVVRIVVRVALGYEHPLTISEELAVLDNINSGRTVLLADTSGLDAESAAEEIQVIRQALACKPVRHSGPRFTIPAGLEANPFASRSLMVTPKPSQVEVPIWVMGDAAATVRDMTSLAVLATAAPDCCAARLVQPALATFVGSVEEDRAVAVAWALSGVTHLLVHLPVHLDLASTMRYVSRFVVPEVGMPDYPRVMSESKEPTQWGLRGGGI